MRRLLLALSIAITAISCSQRNVVVRTRCIENNIIHVEEVDSSYQIGDTILVEGGSYSDHHHVIISKDINSIKHQ